MWQLIAILLLNFYLSVSGELCHLNTTSDLNCTHLHNIHLAVDETIDPCYDFYGYACNNWPHLSQNYEALLDHQMNLKMITLTENLRADSLNTDFFNITHTYYRSCLRAKGRGNAIENILNIIKPAVTGLEWPILEVMRGKEENEWPVDRFDIFALLGKLLDYGLDHILLITYKDASQQNFSSIKPQVILTLTENDISTVLGELIFNQKLRNDYTQRLVEIQQKLNDLSRQFRFQGYSENGAQQFTFGELLQKFPYLQNYFENSQLFENIKDDERFELRVPQYFEMLRQYKWSQGEKQDICNYIMVAMLRHLLPARNDMSHTKLDCIREVRGKLELPLNLLYLDYYRPNELIYDNDVYGIFSKLCEHLTEDNPPPADFTSSNCSASELNVENAPKSFYLPLLRKLFADIPDLQPDNFYQNFLHLLRHRAIKYIHNKETYYHIMVYGGLDQYHRRPFYNYARKMLALPFVLLQTPLYHHSYDPLFKISSLGFTMAKYFPEIDYYGLSRFYNNTMAGSMRGRTDAECIGDFGAADLAYRTYRHYYGRQPEFTDDPWQRLFFISLAQTYC
ncbi:uncharacterized protein LOC133324873, partial [Musca vetustissima]|uniref:uncharacterized protein LOC133324873 n=1 Tax=Musca vetustissima TaxID=27455 RepID=UPI002AB7A84C